MADESPIISQRISPEVPPDSIDPGLLAAVADGDLEAFRRLYDVVVGHAYRVAYSVARNRELAEEITQEVLLELWRNAGNFDPGRGSIRRYVTLVAHGKAVDRVRSLHAARGRETRYRAMNVDLGSGRDPVVDLAVQSHEYSEIRSALGALTTRQRTAVVLVYFEHCSYSEAAARLGVSTGTVKTRVRDAVASLRRALADIER